MLGTLILCGSERAREKGRRREERGLFFLKAETRTMRVLRVLRRTCSPVRDVMVDEGGRRSRGEKKVGEPLRGKRESAASRNNPMAKRMARQNNWIHTVPLIYFCRMSPHALQFTIYSTDNTFPFYLEPKRDLFKCLTNFTTE